MTVCTSGVSASDVEDLAKAAGIKPCWARARCEHGKTREETCVECEGGYVQDARPYFKPRWDVVIAGVSDDGYDVCYIPYNKANATKLLEYRKAHRDLCERTLELLPDLHEESAYFDPDLGRTLRKRPVKAKSSPR